MLTTASLTPGNFAPFGTVLRPDPAGEPFQPLHIQPDAPGWRVAILRVVPGAIRRLHRHPDTEECFAPLKGRPWIAAALPGLPGKITLFELTEPVCVRRHTWHEIVSHDQAAVFIAENADVSGEEHVFAQPLPW